MDEEVIEQEVFKKEVHIHSINFAIEFKSNDDTLEAMINAGLETINILKNLNI